MPNQRRNLALTLQTPGGDNPLTLRLVQTRPLYTGIAVSGLSLVAKGGKAPYSFAINATSNSDLPPGLTIPDPVGPEKADITGTPTAQGHYTFIAVVTDSDSQSFSHSFSLDVRAPIVWVRYNPVPGENLLSYSYRMVASDLAGNFISAGYALESGSLPDGLTIHDNGTVDGDPTFAAIGTSYATISVTTPDGSASIPIAINIFSPFLAFSVENPIRPYATIAFVDQALSTFPTGGMTPYRYAWDNLGDFPWLSFNQNRGTFSGTPPIANIGVQQVITGNAYDALGAGPLPVEFRFTPVFAQTGYSVGDGGDQVFVPPGGFMVLASPDGSIEITPNSSGGLDLETTGAVGGISTINDIPPDSSGNLVITSPDGSIDITEDSNGHLALRAVGGAGGVYITGVGGTGTSGSGYTFTPTPVGFSPDTWEIPTGYSLPTGLALDSTTGVVSGVPSVFGTFDWYQTALESSTGKTAWVRVIVVISNGSPTWETVFGGYNPLIWIKCNETSSSQLVTDGNWGSGGGVLTGSTLGSGGLTFGTVPGIMPSDPSRTCMNSQAGADYIDISGVSPGVDLANFSLYHPYEGTTGNAAIIPWRDVTTGGFFLRYDFTDVVIRLGGNDYTTTYPVSSIMDGNAHLIAVVVKGGTTAELWVDGVKQWSGTISTTSGTANHWIYLQNGNNSFQKPYGLFGDFGIINSGLTDPDHVAIYNAWA
jgi:hypothetical protein